MSKGVKRVEFKVPQAKLAPQADAWVSSRSSEPASVSEEGRAPQLHAVEAAPQAPPPAAKEKVCRLTLDMPESLHRRIKMHSAASGKTMTQVLLPLLDREFPEA